jgi:hypothetical protein
VAPLATSPGTRAASPARLDSSPATLAPSPSAFASSPATLASSPAAFASSPSALGPSPARRDYSPANGPNPRISTESRDFGNRSGAGCPQCRAQAVPAVRQAFPCFRESRPPGLAGICESTQNDERRSRPRIFTNLHEFVCHRGAINAERRMMNDERPSWAGSAHLRSAILFFILHSSFFILRSDCPHPASPCGGGGNAGGSPLNHLCESVFICG